MLKGMKILLKERKIGAKAGKKSLKSRQESMPEGMKAGIFSYIIEMRTLTMENKFW
jgi:hypothetical protein